jgi:hypothetical protein
VLWIARDASVRRIVDSNGGRAYFAGRQRNGYGTDREAELGLPSMSKQLERFPPTISSTGGMAEDETNVRELVLQRSGLVFLSSTGSVEGSLVRAVELELADLGYVVSPRLRTRMENASLDELSGLRTWTLQALRKQLGANQRHEPLFRSFPEGIPSNTDELWWRKVLVHFVQAEDQRCLFCAQLGTTHVLSPCAHVVCDHCFDGSSYSACPVCEHHVDRSSAFFEPSAERAKPQEQVTFELLDLGDNLDEAGKALFVALCERKQALSEDDRSALGTIVREYGQRVLAWLPRSLPLRENVAVVFGTLARKFEPKAAFEAGRSFMTTATDILRFIAVLSGTDGSLQTETRLHQVSRLEPPNHFWSAVAKLVGKTAAPTAHIVTVRQQVSRFKVARLSRSLRRAMLATLEAFDADQLVEDMLRHQSYWVWLGEFLHPHEYAARFPNVARAFAIVRKRAADGTLAPKFRGFHAKLEESITSGALDEAVSWLARRPGELGRRLDHLLRATGANDDALAHVEETFSRVVPKLATPLLVQLRSHFATRARPASIRIYWPKGRTALGVSSRDERTTLPPAVIERTTAAITAELLSRFATKPSFEVCLIDRALEDVIVPFNERTASPAAVSLPRGSKLAVPAGKLTRLFLHWCQPQKGGHTTDLDLSVAFYDAAWQYVGVCSYYQLEAHGSAGVIAKSSGDLRDAPWPDGASEFVDIRREAALASGVRYAVMVVNAYAGMPFSQLERGFAGLMLRDDERGFHFDPRTVELKFALQGEHGIYVPLALDLAANTLHWLDVQSPGMPAFNNVESSKNAIAKLCPELISYFASGARPTMLELGTLHAAARCRRVLIRDAETTAEFLRAPAETPAHFFGRLAYGIADEPRSLYPSDSGSAQLALLLHGDVELPAGSSTYALFRERVVPTLSASDLLS